VVSLWLNLTDTKTLFERTAEKINWAQTRNADARKSHDKTTRENLHRFGINLHEIKHCQWPQSET
jgi:hypothetical protein